MGSSRRQPRLLWIALAATVGMVSLPGVASACSKTPAVVSRSCCASRPASDCGCCKTEASPRAFHAESARPAVIATAFEAPSGGCECRSDDPATPSRPQPAERRTEDRSGLDRADSPGLLATLPWGPIPVARLLTSAATQVRVPLYLRISHLLI